MIYLVVSIKISITSIVLPNPPDSKTVTLSVNDNSAEFDALKDKSTGDDVTNDVAQYMIDMYCEEMRTAGDVGKTAILDLIRNNTDIKGYFVSSDRFRTLYYPITEIVNSMSDANDKHVYLIR